MTTHINSQFLYFDKNFEPHKTYVKKYVKPIRRKVSEKFSSNSYTKLFVPESIKAINRWMKESCDETKRKKFHQLFKKLGSYQPELTNGRFTSDSAYDSNFNTASLYGNNVLKDEAIHMVAAWLRSSATESDKDMFKDVMSALRANHDVFRPSSTYVNHYPALVATKIDKDLQKPPEQVVMEKTHKGYKIAEVSLKNRLAKHELNKQQDRDNLKKRPQTSRIRRDESNTEYNTTYKNRPSSAPANRNGTVTSTRELAVANAEKHKSKHKPYSTHPDTAPPISTHKDEFKVQGVLRHNDTTIVPTKKGHKTGMLYGDGTSSLVEQTSRMNFIPRAIMASGVIGSVVPACDTSYLEKDIRAAKRRAKSLSRKHRQKDEPKDKVASDTHLRTSLPVGGLDMKSYALKGKSIYSLSYNAEKPNVIPKTRPVRVSVGVSSPFGTTSFSANHNTEQRDQYTPKHNKYDLREYFYIKRDDKNGSLTSTTSKAAWAEK